MGYQKKTMSKEEEAITLPENLAPVFLDDLWLRFPDILGTVLGYLDNKSLAKCREVNKTWRDCIAEDKIIWHRIITQNLINDSSSNSDSDSDSELNSDSESNSDSDSNSDS